jgi:hypothetical protein
LKADKNNILYVYLQKKLLEAANGISNKKLSRKAYSHDLQIQRDNMIEDLKKNGKLQTELPFLQAFELLNRGYNLPSNMVTPILYIMRDMELLNIEGKYNHMKIKIINIHKGRMIQKTNTLYKIAGCF